MRLLTYKVFSLLFFVASLYAETVTRTQVVMGTYVSISVNDHYSAMIEKGFDIFKNVDNELSTYKTSATVYKLNQNKSVALTPILKKAILLSKKYYHESDGYFNIAVGSITKDLFHFGEIEKIPTDKELDDANVGFLKLQINPQIVLIPSTAKLDFGGMGKGFAVDEVSEFFYKSGVKDAVVGASGDIRCFASCKIDVKNPFSDTSFATFMTLHDNTGITTSGNYNRYVNSPKYNHLINPKTKRSQDKFVSITLISNLSNSDIDAYATAASVMPPQKAFKFLDSFPLAYIVVDSNKKVTISKNIDEYVKDLIFQDAL